MKGKSNHTVFCNNCKKGFMTNKTDKVVCPNCGIPLNIKKLKETIHARTNL